MRRVALIILLSIAAQGADDKDKTRFAPAKAASYPGHQTIEKITVAAVPFINEDQAKTAFGKVNPYKYGVLPVLVIIENGTGKAVRLDLTAEYVDPGGRHVVASDPDYIYHMNAGDVQRTRIPAPNPLPLPQRDKKGPLGIWEITGRAFTAKMLPEADSAFGFFYFVTEHIDGSTLYLTGLKDAATGQDYFYFEVPVKLPGQK